VCVCLWVCVCVTQQVVSRGGGGDSHRHLFACSHRAAGACRLGPVSLNEY
jgi:hypothetical protein